MVVSVYMFWRIASKASLLLVRLKSICSNELLKRSLNLPDFSRRRFAGRI